MEITPVAPRDGARPADTGSGAAATTVLVERT